MDTWTLQLKGIDTMSNHKKNLKTVLEAYLTSDYANCRRQRTEIVILFNHLDKLG